ncbi:hypothetical protein MBOT_36090 [Mycobacterium botniense]|jgi:hypothetical protein|uniref:Uncharacterized protein n=1 Tax=Mycobacterium botniense TaxID=84962 RepID=A0A7I9Y2I9_9MYCO|nr:hypothetical protein MBOT_36090 [Mycobacterium botniense]
MEGHWSTLGTGAAERLVVEITEGNVFASMQRAAAGGAEAERKGRATVINVRAKRNISAQLRECSRCRSGELPVPAGRGAGHMGVAPRTNGPADACGFGGESMAGRDRRSVWLSQWRESTSSRTRCG